MTSALIRYRLPIGLATVVAAALGFGAAVLWPKTYEATATVVLAAGNVGGGDAVDASPTAERHAALLRSRSVLTAAAEDLAGLDSGALDARVSATPDEGAGLIAVTATGSSPAEATSIANTVAGVYEQESRERVVARLDEADTILQQLSERLSAQIASLREPLAAAPADDAARSQADVLRAQRQDLQTRLGSLSVDLALYGSGIQRVEQAVEPTAPAFPVPLREAAVAGVLGLVVATVIAYRRARPGAGSTPDPAVILGAPLLARIPEFEPSTASTSGAVFRRDAAEAYQFLLSSLEYLASQTDVRSVLVTSAVPGEGKSLTALHLASALAVQGRDVVLVDTDIRARGLTSLLRSGNESGLVALSQGAKLDDVVRRYRLSDSAQLQVVPAGRTPALPTGLFATTPYRDALGEITRRYDPTILDGTPLLTLADASAVATQVDGIVLVLDADTSEDEIYQVRDRLRMIATPLLGYVVNRVAGGPRVDSVRDAAEADGAQEDAPEGENDEGEGWHLLRDSDGRRDRHGRRHDGATDTSEGSVDAAAAVSGSERGNGDGR